MGRTLQLPVRPHARPFLSLSLQAGWYFPAGAPPTLGPHLFLEGQRSVGSCRPLRRPRARIAGFPSKAFFSFFLLKLRPHRAEEGGVGFEGCSSPHRSVTTPHSRLRPFTYVLLALSIFKKLHTRFQYRMPCMRVCSSLWTAVFPSVKWRLGYKSVLLPLTIFTIEVISANAHCVLGTVLRGLSV